MQVLWCYSTSTEKTMTQTLNLDGQKVVYNHESKIAKTTIKEPFYKAGKIFGWSDKSPGLGLNLKVIDFILKTKCTLIIHVESAGNDYWLKNDVLKAFLQQNNVDYKIRDTVLKIIPWKLCTRYRVAVEA